MFNLRLVGARLRALLRRERVEQEMDDELRFHVEMRARENVRRGMTPEEARRAAARSFGSLTRIKEACRDVKGGGIVDTLTQDVRFAARVLRKKPGFMLVAVLTLALGVGATTAIFSVVNSVLLQPLPYPDSERLMRAHWRWGNGEAQAVSAVEYAFWREHARSFEEATGITSAGAGFNLTGGAEPRRVQGLRVTESFFRTVGVPPARGRGFLPEEDRPQGPCAIVISDGLWHGAFGGDERAVGREAQLNGRGCTVVGVMPPGFQWRTPVDVITPAQLTFDPRDQGHNTDMIARLRAGVTTEQAQAEMDALLERFRAAHPGHAGPNERGVRLVSYRESMVGDTSELLLILFGAVALVMLIACANVANLLLARSSARGGEMAVRVALGAGRLRLMRQLMTENLLLALAGGAAGLALAWWGVPALLALSPPSLPRAAEIGLDARAVLFAVAASCLTSLLFGVAPALQATRLDVNRSLKGSSGRAGTSRAGLRGLLVVSEVALSLVLLAGAGLLIASFAKLRAVPLGFDPENMTALQVSLNSERYKTTARSVELQRRVAERIKSLPGVEAVAAVPSLPLERGLNQFVHADTPEGERGRNVESRPVSTDYFRALGLPVLRGRAFTEGDTETSPRVVVVNETLARRFWPAGEAVGQFIREGSGEGAVRWQVVGVAADVKEMGLGLPARETFYLPAAQVADKLTPMLNRWFLTTWLVRTSAPADLDAALREAVREADPELPVARIRPMTEVVSASVATERFITTLMTVFASIALALTAVGLYGVLSYQVSQRTQEIGIRMALGAQAGDVVRLVVGHGLRLAACGVLVGLGAAYALTRLMKSLLFGVTPTDPATFASISALLVLVALAACFVPARRATRVEPTVALRYE